MDVADCAWDTWFWDLTCDFWAENGKRKIMARATVEDSVSLGFRSLRCAAHDSRWIVNVAHPAGWNLSAGESVMKSERRGR